MTEQQRIPARHSGYGHQWPHLKPVCSLLAGLLALAVGAGEFAYQFKRRWTPLQRLYFSAYFQTAHLAQTRNRALRPPRIIPVLVVIFPRGTRLAVDSDLSVVPAFPGAAPSEFRFVLSLPARQAGARGLAWQPLRFDDEWIHAWLARTVYADHSLWQLWRDAWYTCLLLVALLLPPAIRQDRENAWKRHLGRVLKGTNLTTRSDFHQRTGHHTGVGFRTKGISSRWEFFFMSRKERSVVRVARQNESQHFLMLGDSGAGKSSLIRQLLMQIQNRGQTAVVYDPAREYLPQFLNEERGDVVLNPLDTRMPYWNPADEILNPLEAEAIAKSLFPDREHTNPFFIDSPRKILAHLLLYRPTPQQLCQWIAHADPEIDSRIVGTPFELVLSKRSPNQRDGVLGMLEKPASVFRLIPSPEGRRHWNATRWAEKRTGWVFLTSTPPTREALKPLISLWLDLIILRLTSQTGYNQPPAWVIADEVATLETLPNLPMALAESRKSNTRMVLGLQGRSQMEENYGKGAEAMLSQPRTKFYLRTSEPRAAEWISKSIGEVDIEHLREGRTSGDLGLNTSKNASVDSRVEPAILPSEIENLEDLRGFFQTPGFTLWLEFALVKARNRHPDLIERTDWQFYLPNPSAKTPPFADDGPEAEEPSGDASVVRNRGGESEEEPDDTAESRSLMQPD